MSAEENATHGEQPNIVCNSALQAEDMDHRHSTSAENCTKCWTPLDERSSTYYYCRLCSSQSVTLNLCTPCYLGSRHEHRMCKKGPRFVTTEDSEDSEVYDGIEGTVVFAKKDYSIQVPESVRRCLEVMSHTLNCANDGICRYHSCIKMKRVLNHSRNCMRQPGQTEPCPICKQMVALIGYHATDCDYTRCNFPHCAQMKSKLRSLSKK